MLINQHVLAKPGWLQKMAPKDFRRLSSLIYHYVEIHDLTGNKYEPTITDRKALGGIIIDYTLYEKPKNFLSEAEMDRFLHATKSSRHGVRDHLMMLLMYRHGMRVAELRGLTVSALDLKTARILIEN
jgi:integrase